MTNPILEQLTQHRSIREFEDRPLSPHQVTELVNAAQHASTSTFSQQYSIVSVTDPAKPHAIADVTGHRWMVDGGHYFVMVADQYRNLKIAKAHDIDPYMLHSTDKFLASVFDTAIATENIMVAAESMGLGGTIMGSVLNNPRKMIELLNLPEMTFPLLGIALGYPKDKPELKPRLPKALMHFENQYDLDANFDQELTDYDQMIRKYYQSRSTNGRSETFSHHIVSELSGNRNLRSDLFAMIQAQGLMNH
ncbi:NADPH-dependent oxidoreductase [Lacticaseibacillus paracasei]|uniref:NADPH-dependent oxidoreductase n=1 Tax=Lacticaseibacillus paracasei TaxID=1597 RepID=UPI000BDE651F|nr:NADPH-dependent oxidoreductase [Lacticaseibacillus paracasei]RND75249.1 FMN reductase (NADPH) [Lacticaseibacillus paracasei]RND80610.1 FMN reductase (NADPH) [Lacticaseibacillus paracasei]